MENISKGLFDTFFSIPDNSGMENNLNFPFEWDVEVPYDASGKPSEIETYYRWLDENIGPVPKWDVDSRSARIDDRAVRIKFLFKSKEDLMGFKLRWSGDV